MKLNINPEWLLRMAEKEGNSILSVGGLVSRMKVEGDLESLPELDSSVWSRAFPVQAMKKLKFSLPAGLPDAEALLAFFDVSSPERWRSRWESTTLVFRQTQIFDVHKEAIFAWVREAEIIAEFIQIEDFNESKLRSSLGELRQLTRKPVDLALDKAQEICAQVGVALVVVPELPGTRLSGCARWLSESHAMIALTNRYKRDDQLWFTFFHEVGHILMHREHLSLIVDNAAQYMGDDVVDEEMEKYEEEADQFASSTLIPPVALLEFLMVHGVTPTNDDIHEFAESIGIGPGIVVGRLQHDGVLDWHQGNDLKQRIEIEFISED